MATPATTDDWKRLRADVGRLVARRVPSAADAEDVVQDVLLRVWRHGDALRDERFGAWLARIAYTAAAELLRARQRHPLPRHEAPDEPAAPADDDRETSAVIASVLQPFIESLPAHHRDAVRLSELEGLPHAAIAERLGITISGVKSRVQRGRAQLRERLGRCCEIALDTRGAPMSCSPRADGEQPPGCCGEGCGTS